GILAVHQLYIYIWKGQDDATPLPSEGQGILAAQKNSRWRGRLVNCRIEINCDCCNVFDLVPHAATEERLLASITRERTHAAGRCTAGSGVSAITGSPAGSGRERRRTAVHLSHPRLRPIADAGRK